MMILNWKNWINLLIICILVLLKKEVKKKLWNLLKIYKRPSVFKIMKDFETINIHKDV